MRATHLSPLGQAHTHIHAARAHMIATRNVFIRMTRARNPAPRHPYVYACVRMYVRACVRVRASESYIVIYGAYNKVGTSSP